MSIIFFILKKIYYYYYYYYYYLAVFLLICRCLAFCWCSSVFLLVVYLFGFLFLFYDLSVGPKHGILFQKKSCSSSDGILCTCSSPVLPEPVKVKKLTRKHRILNNSICNRFNLRHPHNASGVKGSLFLLHTVYCTCTHLAC